MEPGRASELLRQIDLAIEVAVKQERLRCAKIAAAVVEQGGSEAIRGVAHTIEVQIMLGE